MQEIGEQDIYIINRGKIKIEIHKSQIKYVRPKYFHGEERILNNNILFTLTINTNNSNLFF